MRYSELKEIDMARIRSPNYPQIDLGDAINLVAEIHKREGTNFASREVIAEHLGYSSVNGASEKKTSAITAYGLLERNSDRDLRVSDLAMRILHPEDDREKEEALAEAAGSPNLFREIRDKWPDTPPSDASLRSYLVRTGFNQNSVDQVVAIYRATCALADPKKIRQTAVSVQEERGGLEKESAMPDVQVSPPPQAKIAKPIVFDMETVSGSYSFDNIQDLEEFIEKLQKIKALLPSKH